jgi:hypothetical protein
MHIARVPLNDDLIATKQAVQLAPGLRGMWAAKPLIALPPFLALPILLAFREGDYIAPIVGALWTLTAVYGNRLRIAAKPGSSIRFKGFCVTLFSIIGALSMFALTAAFIADGVWRWTPPGWWSLI